MYEGWYRFWAMDVWRSWIERRRQWLSYSRDIRSMRTRLMALEDRASAAHADYELAVRNGTWVADLTPRRLPCDLEPIEVGLGTVDGVELHELRTRRGRETWTFVDRGVVHFTNRRMIFSGSETVSFPFSDIVEDVVGKRGWELSVAGRDGRQLLAGPVEQLRVTADGVVDGIAGQDPRIRWIDRRNDAQHRLQVVAEARDTMRRTYDRMAHPDRPVSPGWIPAGMLALVVLVTSLGSLGAEAPPPPTVMSVQITTTTSAPILAEVSDEALLLSSSSTAACHAAYSGACVPAGVSDVDCRGSGDDGPYFVGPVTVVGDDVYGLDTDGDGLACGA